MIVFQVLLKCDKFRSHSVQQGSLTRQFGQPLFPRSQTAAEIVEPGAQPKRRIAIVDGLAEEAGISGLSVNAPYETRALTLDLNGNLVEKRAQSAESGAVRPEVAIGAAGPESEQPDHVAPPG
jgi:hypothetical protein